MEKEYAEYLLRKTRQDYNLIAEDFSRTRQEIWEEIRFLGDYAVAGDKVLDLGCGNGRLLELFKNKDINYTGVDASEKLIEIAKRKYQSGKYKFLVSDGLNLPFPDNFFDKIFSIAVLHHIPSEELRIRFLEETRRVLKPGGLLILTVWKFHQPKELYLIFKYNFLRLLGFSRLDFFDIFEPWGKKTERYYHCFFQAELSGLVKWAGFIVIKNTGIIKNKRGNRQNIYLVAEK